MFNRAKNVKEKRIDHMAVNEQEVQTEEKNHTKENYEKNPSMNLVIIGGVVGAGVGYLSNPEMSKKVIKSVQQSEVMRVAGQEFRKSVQEILTEQALTNMRKVASGYISKYEGTLQPSTKKKSNENEKVEEDSNSKYEEIKEENKQLNDRLERIENMLSNLVESKKL
jgi:gas vesicle protein